MRWLSRFSLWARSITLGIVLGVLVLATSARAVQTKTLDPSPLVSQRMTAEQVKEPTHIRIPRIKVDADIVPVGIDSDGAMDSPKDPGHVGWYEYGAHPGDIGATILTGHLDTQFGLPAVFWRLHSLETGDFVEIQDASGSTLTYAVLSVENVNTADASTKDIFTKVSGKTLYLVTCAGRWDWARGTYGKRLVVTASLVAPGDLPTP